MIALCGQVGLVAVAVLIQHTTGRDIYDIPKHHVANWRAKPSYLVSYEFIAPGESHIAARLNSCSAPNVPPAMQCSGHGICKSWGHMIAGAPPPISFCECAVGFVDPECRTPRKSQLIAYSFSLLLGYTGADQFYLGYYLMAFVKLLTLGGFGIWYFYDVVAIGSGPVYTASRYRVAADLPPWAFVLTAVSWMLFLGFVFSLRSLHRDRNSKRRDAMLLAARGEELLSSAGQEAASSPSWGGWNGAVPALPWTPAPPRADIARYGATQAASTPWLLQPALAPAASMGAVPLAVPPVVPLSSVPAIPPMPVAVPSGVAPQTLRSLPSVPIVPATPVAPAWQSAGPVLLPAAGRRSAARSLSPPSSQGTSQFRVLSGDRVRSIAGR